MSHEWVELGVQEKENAADFLQRALRTLTALVGRQAREDSRIQAVIDHSFSGQGVKMRVIITLCRKDQDLPSFCEVVDCAKEYERRS